MKVRIVTRIRSEDCWFFDQLYGKRLVHLYWGDAILILNLKNKGRCKWQYCCIPLWAHQVKVRQKLVDCVWNVMAHAQKPDFVFRQNGRVHLNRRGRQFSRLLVAEVCASAVVMLDTPCSEVVWEYWLPTPFASFHFTSLPCVTVCHQVSNALCTVVDSVFTSRPAPYDRLASIRCALTY
jgi:hypothetical protein